MNANFAAAIRRGAQDAQNVMGETFTHSGASYTGVFTQAVVDQSMQDAGYNEMAEYVLRAIRSQFGTLPAVRDKITWRGSEWIIMQIMQPGNEHVFMAGVRRRA